MTKARTKLGRMRTAFAGKRTPAGPGRPVLPFGAVRLLEMGMFDRELYEAQCGLTFPDVDAAVRHFVEKGAGDYSPHALLDFAFLPSNVQARLQAGRTGIRPLLDHLRRQGSYNPTSYFFDPSALEVTRDELEQHPGGALGYFLERADDTTPLPGAEEYTLPQARAIMIENARRVRAAPDLSGPRTTDTWDDEREAAWRARYAGMALPTAEGPLVSVVMPVRNRPAVVVDAIRSLQAQTLTEWELLVVDDGSTDQTPDVLDALAADDPRIRVLRQDWAGVCAARNTAVAEARSPYLAFLDSDNTWLPDFLRLAVTAMAAEDLDAAYAGLTYLSADGCRRYRSYEGGLDHLLMVNHIDLNTVVVKTSLVREIGGFDVRLRRWVDHDLVIEIARRTSLPFLPIIAVEYDHSTDQLDRITRSESDAWQFVVLDKHWVRWAEVEAGVSERVPGRVSVVVPTWNDARMTHAAVAAVLRNSGEHDVEVVVVDNGSRPATSMSLQLLHLAGDRIRLERLPRNLNFSTGSNYGLARSTGEFVVFLNNDTQPRPGWLTPLIDAMADPSVLGVQPLLLYPDDSIQTAGTVFPLPGHLPTHFLVGHPPEDAARIRTRDFTAVTAAALMMRAADVIALRGFDPIYQNGMEDVDLCLRASDLRAGTFRLEPSSQVTHFESQTTGRSTMVAENRRVFADRWAERLTTLSDEFRWSETGFAVAAYGPDRYDVPAARPVTIRPASGLVNDDVPLRWAINIPSNGGEVGDAWGDTHFADALAAALRDLGHEVVTHRHGAHTSPAAAFDDVVLGIRGLDPIYPVAGKINVLWVISHPEDVSPDELRCFDVVYAASAPWAELMTQRCGRPVEVLLQATDRRRRADLDEPVGDGSHAVFVGAAPRGRFRPIVQHLQSAGVTATVHGPRWRHVLPAELVGEEYVPNHQLMNLYRSHGLVLADHWADMAESGFMANRLFDAVASGARVITDPVAGLELFEGAVQAYRDEADLAELCSPAGRASRFPDDATMARIADRVAEEHSFDARARTISEAVTAHAAQRRAAAAAGSASRD